MRGILIAGIFILVHQVITFPLEIDLQGIDDIMNNLEEEIIVTADAADDVVATEEVTSDDQLEIQTEVIIDEEGADLASITNDENSVDYNDEANMLVYNVVYTTTDTLEESEPTSITMNKTSTPGLVVESYENPNVTTTIATVDPADSSAYLNATGTVDINIENSICNEKLNKPCVNEESDPCMTDCTQTRCNGYGICVMKITIH